MSHLIPPGINNQHEWSPESGLGLLINKKCRTRIKMVTGISDRIASKNVTQAFNNNSQFKFLIGDFNARM